MPMLEIFSSFTNVPSWMTWSVFKHPELVDYHKLNQSNADIIAANLELLRKTRMN